MTTVKTERKDAAPEPKKETRKQDELKTVSEIHTLSQMLYGEIARTNPWATPSPTLANFQNPTVYPPSMAPSAAPVMAGTHSPFRFPNATLPGAIPTEARKMYLTDPTLYGATLPQREFPAIDPFLGNFFGNLPMQGVPWRNFPQANLPLQGFPYPQANLPMQGFPYPQTNLPMQGFPYPQTNLPMQGFPYQTFQHGIPFQGFPMQAPWQNIQKFVPPIYPFGQQPYAPQTFGYPPYMATPFVPTAMNPYLPVPDWQRFF